MVFFRKILIRIFNKLSEKQTRKAGFIALLDVDSALNLAKLVLKASPQNIYMVSTETKTSPLVFTTLKSNNCSMTGKAINFHFVEVWNAQIKYVTQT